MARKVRSDFDGSWHHVMNRGARAQAIFHNDHDRRSFLSLLPKSTQRFRTEVHAYALMGNHFHVLVHSPTSGLSDSMHYASGVYTQGFNKRHGFDGSLFKERFKSVPITTEDQLTWVSRYIHLNSVDIHHGADLRTYEWSSYPAYAGCARPPGWLHTKFVLSMFGSEPSRYRKFVESPDSEVPTPTVAHRSSAQTPDHESTRIVSIDDVEIAVAGATSVAPAELRVINRGQPNMPRSIALAIAVDKAALSPAQLATRYGLASASSVWSSISRLRARAQADDAVASAVTSAEELLREAS